MLTRRIQYDPELPGVGLVIFDEVHERNLTADTALAFAIEVASTIRPDLAIVAMSATPDTDGLRRVLDAPVVTSDGRMFDVDVRWLPRTPTRIDRWRSIRRRKGARGPRRPAPSPAASTRSNPMSSRRSVAH